MAIVTRAGKGSPLTHNEVDNNFTELDTIPNGKVFPKTQNIGIRVDTASPTFPWEDIIGKIDIIPGAPNPGSLELYRGSIYQVALDETDTAFINFHMPHDYVVGSQIHAHVHWSHISTTVTGGSVTFNIDMSYAKGHDQGAFGAPATVSIFQSASTTQYQHMVAETQASTSGGSPTALDSDLLEPDGLIMCRVILDSNDLVTSDFSTPKVFVHFVDIHYQSTGIGTKNKSPNFWGA
jgi:hypothetical protein